MHVPELSTFVPLFEMCLFVLLALYLIQLTRVRKACVCTPSRHDECIFFSFFLFLLCRSLCQPSPIGGVVCVPRSPFSVARSSVAATAWTAAVKHILFVLLRCYTNNCLPFYSLISFVHRNDCVCAGNAELYVAALFIRRWSNAFDELILWRCQYEWCNFYLTKFTELFLHQLMPSTERQRHIVEWYVCESNWRVWIIADCRAYHVNIPLFGWTESGPIETNAIYVIISHVYFHLCIILFIQKPNYSLRGENATGTGCPCSNSECDFVHFLLQSVIQWNRTNGRVHTGHSIYWR